MSLPMPFPRISTLEDYNPAIRLFGRRFIKEQTLVEYLAEFLAIAFSDKRIGDTDPISSPLPSLEDLKRLSGSSGANLQYKPPIKLNLKLFAFLTCCPVEARHDVHRQQYQYLIQQMEEDIKSGSGSAQEVREWIEDLFRGLQGAGFNRAWCAQTFYPISAGLLTQETIWNETKSKRRNIRDWNESLEEFKTFYSTTRRDFLARGGELLYLQLCNLFTLEPATLRSFACSMGFKEDEAVGESLHQSLQHNLQKLRGEYTASLDQLADYIEMLDPTTHEKANNGADFLTCGWCPAESWKEAYLFAVEINRVLTAMLDPVERLELMMTGCALQVLRSLCAQSVRYTSQSEQAQGGALGYAWVFSPPQAPGRQQRLPAQRNLEAIQGLIQKALRHEELQEQAARNPKKLKAKDSLYREADDRYGHKLFLFLSKKLGIVTPQKGPGARFIMTDKLLRYLVLALLRPGERRRYDEFLTRLYRHYGIAVEGEQLADALLWSQWPPNSSVQPRRGSWLMDMLRAGGFLTELSDACSIVHNTFSDHENGGIEERS